MYKTNLYETSTYYNEHENTIKGWVEGGEGRMNQPREETWLRHRWCEEPPQDSG
jgi:hypothetical protein